MAIPSQPTTAISLGPTNTPTQRSISNEFGDTAPHQLNQFRRAPGGSIPENPANAGIPTLSGQPISFSQFNGATSSPGITPLNYTISANTTDLNLLTYATTQAPVPTRYTAGTPGYSITFTIDPGVLVSTSSYAPSFNQGALNTGNNSPTGWHPDVTLTLINQGAIVGAGGIGGAGGGPGFPAGSPSQPASGLGVPGTPGGTAIIAQRAITIQNAGQIAGGGGGGGGGAGSYQWFPDVPTPFSQSIGGGGGGGGAGRIAGVGGDGSPPSPRGQDSTNQTIPQISSAGNAGTPGPGGGPGGGLGQSAPYNPTYGYAGAMGFYAVGTSNITWQATGTRQGNSSPTIQKPATTLQYQIQVDTPQLDLPTYATSPSRPAPTRWPGGAGYRLEFTIGPGVIISDSIYSLSGNQNQITPNTEFWIFNQGVIAGGGGSGGQGRSTPGPAPLRSGTSGSAGSTAIFTNHLLYIQNQGTILGGGGGGGGAGGYPSGIPIPLRAGGGGGGGAGRSAGFGGQGQTGSTPSQGQDATNQPIPGGISAPGGGGTTTKTGMPAPLAPLLVTVTGGNGGAVGQDGQTGQTNPIPAPLGGPSAGGGGGAAGYYTLIPGQNAAPAPKNKIVWIETGTRQGQAPPAS